MRASMLEGGLEVIQHNCNRKNQDLALFEQGSVYTTASDRYIQQSRLSVWISGNIRGQQWNQKATKANTYYLKGLINNLISYSGIRGVSTSYDETGIQWKWKGKNLASAWQVPAGKLKTLDIKQEV